MLSNTREHLSQDYKKIFQIETSEHISYLCKKEWRPNMPHIVEDSNGTDHSFSFQRREKKESYHSDL